MSASANYVNQMSVVRWADWSATSGVSLARIQSAAAGGTLSAPEMRDLIAAAKLLSYSFTGTTQALAVTENAGVPHPSVKKVSINLMSENLY